MDNEPSKQLNYFFNFLNFYLILSIWQPFKAHWYKDFLFENIYSWKEIICTWDIIEKDIFIYFLTDLVRKCNYFMCWWFVQKYL